MGFEAAFPSRLTFGEQVKLFSEADVIVGSLGAGMTNILFAPPAASVVMFDPGLFDFFYWDISCLARQTFYWAFTEKLARYTHERAVRNFVVDLDLLKYSLKLLGLR